MTTITELSSYISNLSQLQKTFKTADTDGNGSISATEFEAVAKASAGLSGKDGLATTTIFQKLDTNGDKQITQAELTQGINLATQVQSVLLQGQEITSGGAYASLLGNTSSTTSLFGGTNDYSSLTSSLLGGGSASTSLTSLLTGGNTNAVTSAGLFGGLSDSTQALIQNLLARYTPTDTSTTTTQTA